MIYNKRLDIKDIAVNKLNRIITPKYKLLRTKKIWFNHNPGDISSITFEDRYNILVRTNGSRVFPRAIKGEHLLKLISYIESNDIFTYFESNGQKCKVKPKKSNDIK